MLRNNEIDLTDYLLILKTDKMRKLKKYSSDSCLFKTDHRMNLIVGE